MNCRRHLRTLVFASCAVALLASAGDGHAGFADALKKKLADKATKKAEEAVDKTAGKTEQAAPPGEGAEEVPAGSVVAVSRDLRVDISSLSGS